MSEEAKLEKLWMTKFKEYFKDQEKRFIEKLEKAKKGVAETMGIDRSEELQSVITIIDPLMYETAMLGVKQASKLIDQPIVADLDFLRQWLDKVSLEIGETITDTTINAFDDTLREGINKGEGIAELTKRVQEIFTFANKTRAELIARTETARGITEAHRQTYARYGFYEVKWLLAPGSCETCIDLSHLKWNINTIESQIPVHPNCKCDFTPIVMTDEE